MEASVLQFPPRRARSSRKKRDPAVQAGTVVQFPSGAVPSKRREPYTVERYPAIGGAVRIVGYDGEGLIALEVTMPFAMLTARTLGRIQDMMMSGAF